MTLTRRAFVSFAAVAPFLRRPKFTPVGQVKYLMASPTRLFGLGEWDGVTLRDGMQWTVYPSDVNRLHVFTDPLRLTT